MLIFSEVKILKAKIEKNKVKEYYLSGYNAKEISKKLNYDVEAVRKCIQRNFKELKLEHDISVIAKRETIKATNYEANKFISDRSFIMKNRSIYKTKQDGDIVVNRMVAPIISWDTPQRLSNENKII
jgi:predicted DNA-binding protein YlxM (UPF0122 family)